jgi:hypothetical protein
MLEQADKREECCKQSANLTAEQRRPDLVVRTCNVCGRRHFELTANPGVIGVRGAGL